MLIKIILYMYSNSKCFYDMKIDDFLNFENKYNLFEKKIDNFNFWGYIRFELNTKLTYYDNRTSINGKRKKINYILKLIFHILIEIFKSLNTINCKNKILFIQSGIIDSLVDGKKICRFTDLIINEFENRSQWISDVHVSNKCRLRTVKYSLGILRIPYYFAYLFKYRYSKYKYEILKVSNEIAAYIYKDFEIEISVSYLCDLIYKTVIGHSILFDNYKKFLLKVRPRCIVYECYYTMDHMCINEVAKKINIDTIELQHGVTDRFHVAYNFANNTEFPFLPSKVFYWGEYWKNNTRLPIKSKNKIVTGYPWYDYNVNNYKHVKNCCRVCRILVLSQPTITYKLLSIVNELIDIFESEKFDYELIYKLHPVEYGNSNSIFNYIKKNKKITIINNSNKCIYSLFANSDVQIGENSAALFEGIHYNLKTYIYDSNVSREYMQILVEKYNAEYFSNAQVLYDLIKNYDYKNFYNANNIFFKSNSICSIKNELNKYVQ